jgi:hypothetical protein
MPRWTFLDARVPLALCLGLALSGCGGRDGSPSASTSSAAPAAGDSVRGTSLEACVRAVGAPADPNFVSAEVEEVLEQAGLRLSDALTPPDDDYWLAVDFADERRATRAAVRIAREGIAAPNQVRRSGASLAIVPPAGGPLEDVYRDLPDVKRIRECTSSFAVVSGRRG